MSGGSFNYAHTAVWDIKALFDHLSDFRDMHQWLLDNKQYEAADEVDRLVLAMETAQHRIQVRAERLYSLMKVTDLAASHDCGLERIAEELEKLDD